MIPAFAPQLVSNDGLAALRAAIVAPTRYAIEPKVDGVRALVTFSPDGIKVRGRKGLLRSSWLACRELRASLDTVADALPMLWRGSTLDGELWAGSFHRTMALLSGTRPLERGLRLIVFDLPALGGVDLRHESWDRRRERLELLARAFFAPVELSPLLEPSVSLAERVLSGDMEGIVLKDREAPYRSGCRRGWAKLKSPAWHEQHRERFRRSGTHP